MTRPVALPPVTAAVLADRARLSGPGERVALVPQPTSLADQIRDRLKPGSVVLGAPDRVPALWGTGHEVPWAQGEARMIVGPAGVEKDHPHRTAGPRPPRPRGPHRPRLADPARPWPGAVPGDGPRRRDPPPAPPVPRGRPGRHRPAAATCCGSTGSGAGTVPAAPMGGRDMPARRGRVRVVEVITEPVTAVSAGTQSRTTGPITAATNRSSANHGSNHGNHGRGTHGCPPP
jgi:hypothetical protein